MLPPIPPVDCGSLKALFIMPPRVGGKGFVTGFGFAIVSGEGVCYFGVHFVRGIKSLRSAGIKGFGALQWCALLT